ncbi:hypothetical protein ACFE04_006099 [Oxalis oulophora]
MDLVASCKDKLPYFRIKELKDVLTQLGLSKQGKKQDLVDRIVAILTDDQVSKIWAKKGSVSKEEVAKLVDDTYRRMQISGASDLASTGPGVSGSSDVKIKGEIEENFQPEMNIRCPCGSSLKQGAMVKCEDPRCQVWQHIICVIIPEKPMEGDPPVPDMFYCEICRLNRADPFWVTVAHPLYPIKLSTTSVPSDSVNPMQSIEKTFQLTRADKDLLSKQEYDVQAWCMLFNDKVIFRMQWPQYTELQVNGVPVRAINRPGSQLLGANGRDDGPIITPCTKDGINKISVTGCDARVFCLGVRIVKRRTVQQILNLIPKESDGERFEDALARVVRCIGGTTSNDADSDSDLEVVADFFGVNLRCPMSGSRIKIAGRFKPCVHMGCFDLEVFVELNQRSRKWQCPICLKNYSLESVIIDPYFSRITSKMRYCGEDVTEIEVKPDGSWRARAKSEFERKELSDLIQWHFPDGTLYIPPSEIKPKVEMFKQVKQEGGFEGTPSLKLGIRKNQNGIWEVSKPDDMNTSSGNRFSNHEQKVIPMSSSATGSGPDGEDTSVNQGGNFDFSNRGIEFNSTFNIDPADGFTDRNQSAPSGQQEVIVLSDSEDEDDILISSGGPTYDNSGGVNFSMPPPGITDPYTDDPNVGTGLGLFNTNDDDYEMPMWALPTGPHQGNPGFQLFNTDADVSGPFIDSRHGSINCSTSMNDYTLAPDTGMGPTTLLPNSSAVQSTTDINDGLVDNPTAFADLQIFLPTEPLDTSLQSNVRNQVESSNGVHTEDWISLRLGDGASGAGHELGVANGFSSRQQIAPREGGMDSLTDPGLYSHY